MNLVWQVIKEQITNIHLIFRLAIYDIKSSYQMHYLGILWQILNPMSQILVFWFVFGLGIREGAPVGEIPFFVWLVVGLIPWFFISSTITQGSNSVYGKVNMVSKMKFPVSVLPTIVLVKNTFNYIVMNVILVLVIIVMGVELNNYLIQIPYYLLSMYVFLFAVTLLFSTLSTIIRDFQLALQSAMRLLFFLTPILWDASNLDRFFQTILKVNPFYYLVDGFRSAFLGYGWFYEDINYTIYFWLLTLSILFLGAFLHFKFRNKFVDYL